MHGLSPHWSLGDERGARESFSAFNTLCWIYTPQEPTPETKTLFKAIRDSVLSWQKRLSRFDPLSLISRINREAHLKAIPLPPGEWSLLRLCKEYHRSSRGLFDVSLGRVADRWRETLRKGAPPPSREESRALAEAAGMGRIFLDNRSRTVRFLSPGPSLDLGALGKGFILEGIAELLLSRSAPPMAVSLGGSSILFHRLPSPGRPWSLLLEAPLQPNLFVKELLLPALSATTSGGTYKHAPLREGIGGHVFHPLSGTPVDASLQYTVLSTSPLLGEFLSTTLLLLPPEEISLFLEAFPGVEAFRVTSEGVERLTRPWYTQEGSDHE